MKNFLNILAAICFFLLFITGFNYLPPLLSGLVLAVALRPLLTKFPYSKISHQRLRTFILLISFLAAFGTMSTYIVIASGKAIAKHVDFKHGKFLEKTDADKASDRETEKSASKEAGEPQEQEPEKATVAEPIKVDAAATPEPRNEENSNSSNSSNSSITEKIKSFMKKIPGMNSDEITRTWNEISSRARSMGLSFLSKFLTAGPAVIISIVVFLISFVMFFWSYEELKRTIKSFEKKFPDIEKCITFFENSTQATLIGTLVVGFAQGSIVGIGSAIAGLDSFVLIGLCAFFASFVPFFGTALVWGSVLLYSVFSGDSQAAIIVGVTGCLSSVADNLILPTFVGSKNKVNPLLLFVIVLGMLDAIGVWGLFLGPVLSIFATRVIELWLERQNKTQKAL